MTRLGWTVVGGIVLLLVLVVGLLILFYDRAVPTQAPTSMTATSTAVDPSTLSIYTSGQYGLSFFYPNSATISDEFSATNSPELPWRKNAIATGTLVARITAQDGEVHIGFSSAPKEVSSCIKAAPAEKSTGVFSTGSTTWSKFTFDSIGTDDQQHITSYRTIHNNSCYALEMYTPFSPEHMASSTTPSFSLENIMQSFTFAGV